MSAERRGGRRTTADRVVPQTGTPVALRRLEPVVPLALAGHAVAVQLVDSLPAVSIFTAAAGLLALLGVAGLLGVRSPWAVALRAAVVLVVGYALMVERAPGSGYVLLWFFVLVAVYPLVLPAGFGRMLVLLVPTAYLMLVPLDAADGPLPVAALRAVALALIGLFVQLAAGSYRAAVAERDQALALLDAYLDASPVGLGYWDHSLVLRRLNGALATLTGLPVAAQVDRRIDEVPGLPEALTLNLRRALDTGTPVPDIDLVGSGREWTASSFPVREAGRSVGVGAVVVDVTEQRRAARQLAHSATHDALTGLPNRVLLSDRLGVAIAQAARGSGSVGVLFCDIDRFKVVNDSLGHAAGDEVLRIAATRLMAAVRAGDTVARTGGDEYAVLCAEPGDVDHLVRVGERICAAMREPMRVGGRDVVSTVSVGVVLGGPDDLDGGELLRAADLAMYQAKEAGRDRVAVLSAGNRGDLDDRLALHGALRLAVESGQIEVVYQPVVDLRATTTAAPPVVGLEALARWDRPGVGPVPPAVFVPVAEELGLIGLLGEQVLRTACAQTARWRVELGRPLRVAVNLSARQLAEPGLVGVVENVLAEVGLPASALELEITESVLMIDVERSRDRLGALRRLGVTIAIDDFGTGFSSLAYLRDLPVDVLKVDRSFTTRLPQDRAMVGLIVDLARAIGASTVVEGVEDAQALAEVTALGCDRAQGYHLARPMPAAQVPARIGAG